MAGVRRRRHVAHGRQQVRIGRGLGLTEDKRRVVGLGVQRQGEFRDGIRRVHRDGGLDLPNAGAQDGQGQRGLATRRGRVEEHRARGPVDHADAVHPWASGRDVAGRGDVPTDDDGGAGAEGVGRLDPQVGDGEVAFHVDRGRGHVVALGAGVAGVVELKHVVAHIHHHLEPVSAGCGPWRSGGTVGCAPRGHAGFDDPFLAPHDGAGVHVAKGHRLPPPGRGGPGPAVGEGPRREDGRTLGDGERLDDQVRVVGEVQPEGGSTGRHVVVLEDEFRHGVAGVGLHQHEELAGHAVGDAEAARDGVGLAGTQGARAADHAQRDVVDVAQGGIGGQDHAVRPCRGAGGLPPNVGDLELDRDMVAAAQRTGRRRHGRHLEVGQAHRRGGDEQGLEDIGLQQAALRSAATNHRVVSPRADHVHLCHAVKATASARLKTISIQRVIQPHDRLERRPRLQSNVEEHRPPRLHRAEVEVVQVPGRVDVPDAHARMPLAGRRQAQRRRAGNRVVRLRLGRRARRRQHEAELVLGVVPVVWAHQHEVGAVSRNREDRRLARAVVVGVEPENGVAIRRHDSEVELRGAWPPGVLRGQHQLLARACPEAPPVRIARSGQPSVGGGGADAVARQVQ